MTIEEVKASYSLFRQIEDVEDLMERTEKNEATGGLTHILYDMDRSMYSNWLSELKETMLTILAKRKAELEAQLAAL